MPYLQHHLPELVLERNRFEDMPDIDSFILQGFPSSVESDSKLLLVSSIPEWTDDSQDIRCAMLCRGAELGQTYYTKKLILAQLTNDHCKHLRSLYHEEDGQFKVERERSRMLSRIQKLGEATQPLHGFTIGFWHDNSEPLLYANMGDLRVINDQVQPIAFAGTYDSKERGPQLTICPDNDDSFTEQMSDTMKQTYQNNFTTEDKASVQSLVAQGESASSMLDIYLCKKSRVVLRLGSQGELLNSFHLIHCDTFRKFEDFRKMTNFMMRGPSGQAETMELPESHLSLG